MDNPQEENQQDKPIPEETVKPGEVINIDDLPDRKLGESLPKPHLNGQLVKISDVALVAGEIKMTRSNKQIKSFQLKLTYEVDKEGGEVAFESYGGFGKFINPDGSESILTLNWQGTNQGALIFNKWLDFVGLEVEKVSLKDFLMGLKGLKAKLKEIPVNNPMKNEMTHKNVVEFFIKEGE